MPAARPRGRTRRSTRARRARRSTGSRRGATRAAARRPRPARRSGPTPPGCGTSPTPGSPASAPVRAASRRRGRSLRGPRAALPRARGRSSARAMRGAGRRARPDRRARRSASTRRPSGRHGRRGGGARCARRTRSRGPTATCTTTRASRTTPCGGERPAFSSSWTRSSTRTPAERADLARRPDREPPDVGCAVTTTTARPASSDLRQHVAPVERVEPVATPPPAEEREQGQETRPAEAPAHVPQRNRARPRAPRTARPHGAGPRSRVRSRARAQGRAGARVRPGDHDGITSPRRLSIRAGPIPGSRRGRRPR